MFKLNKKLQTGKCSAMRCKETGDLTDLLMDGREVELCPRHKAEFDALAAGQAALLEAHPILNHAEHLNPPEKPTNHGESMMIGGNNYYGSTRPAPSEPLAEGLQPVALNGPAPEHIGARAGALPCTEPTVMVAPGLTRDQAQEDYTIYSDQLAQLREGFAITAENQSVASQEFLVGIKTTMKELAAKKQAALKPLRDVVNVVNSWFKPGEDALKGIEGVLKDAINTYLKGAEQQKLELLQAGEHTEALAMPDPHVSGNIQRRQNWQYEIVDPEQVPGVYWAIDEKKIGAVVKHNKGATAIPGVRVWDDGTLAVKS